KQKIDSYSLKWLAEVKSVPHNLMPKLISKVDVVVIPRRRLSSTDLVMPLKLLEAGATKKPVIIAKTRIIEQTFQDLKNVVMYEPENPEDLAEKILLVYKDGEFRARLGEALFDFAKNYDWHIIIRKLRRNVHRCIHAT
ncbi:MAG: glycosyltransferase, partial [Candidatus Baldrarchaeia archaeon]